MTVALVTRQGCHLCDQALRMLQELGAEPQLLDVDADERLFELYDWRVPVVLLDGAVVAEGKIERRQLERALSHHGRS